MGGSGSHQFTVPCESGEDVIVYTQDGAYAANIEKAEVDALPKATPLPERLKPAFQLAASQGGAQLELLRTGNFGRYE